VRIWLVQSGEPTPIDDGDPRPMRYALLAELLADRGHDVVWWTSAFDHYRKQMRPVGSHRIDTESAGYKLVTLPALGYRRHISPRRFADHAWVGVGMLRQGRRSDAPDIILHGLPTLELGAAATHLAGHFNCPVVCDILDLWPDLFAELLPRRLRFLGRTGLFPLEALANYQCRRSTAIIGQNARFVNWGLQRARRAVGPHDGVVRIAFQDRPDLGAAPADIDFWMSRGVDLEGSVVVFAGSFSRHFDFDPVVEVARRWAKTRPGTTFVLCGDGPERSRIVDICSGLDNVLLPGWVDRGPLSVLLGMSVCGLAPYQPTLSFLDSIPNKVVEYLAFGLPVVTSLGEGAVGELSRSNGFGACYRPGDGDELDSQLGRLVDDSSARTSAAEAARQTFLDQFDANRVYGELGDRLVEIVGVSRAT